MNVILKIFVLDQISNHLTAYNFKNLWDIFSMTLMWYETPKIDRAYCDWQLWYLPTFYFYIIVVTTHVMQIIVCWAGLVFRSASDLPGVWSAVVIVMDAGF